MRLSDITEDMFSFIEQETGVKKDAVLEVGNDEETRQKLLKELFEIEVDEVMEAGDGPVSKRGRLAADIVTLISYTPPEEAEE